MTFITPLVSSVNFFMVSLLSERSLIWYSNQDEQDNQEENRGGHEWGSGLLCGGSAS